MTVKATPNAVVLINGPKSVAGEVGIVISRGGPKRYPYLVKYGAKRGPRNEIRLKSGEFEVLIP